ncbi:MAG: hypothetical protein GTO46_13720 [Gemmatimonadetes bacterium]|nr:hypothetical protein [Gemmatimonadota bacterium]NIO32640.1 hypothetical protein [Gemmatimonadota bacterium]
MIVGAVAVFFASLGALAQVTWDPNAVGYEGPSSWQLAAVAALNRHLPTDSGFFVLGPIDLGADLPDTTDLVRSTLRIIAPDPRSSAGVSRRLWFPTGGVALEELQPSDTLAHELPPGYAGRFLEGTIVGERVFVQVFTVREHRWLLWAQRAQVAGITELVEGPVARYSAAVATYLAMTDSGLATEGPPRAIEYGLDPTYELYDQPPEPVIRDREGYTRLLDENRTFSLGDAVRDVHGFVPGPALSGWVEEQADPVLFVNKDTEVALQHRYRDYETSGGSWLGYPVLAPAKLSSLRPGRYIYVADRYGAIRVARTSMSGFDMGGAAVTHALLAHGEPLRAAGELVLSMEPGGPLGVTELNIRSEEYFFSNRSLTLYDDVEQRSDRYVAAVGHVLRGLELARLPRDNMLIRKF